MLSNDTGVHAPPSSGTYDYNAFKPSAGGFPGLVASYTDPVFGAVDPTGSVVTRLTVNYPNDIDGQTEDIYGHHWLNADGTSFFWRDGSASRISGVNKVSDGSLIRASVPGSGDRSWHPTDPNAYFYFSGADLRKYNVSAGTFSVVHTFPATLLTLGGSQDFVDETGRYFVVFYNDGTSSARVYDAVANVIYSGPTIAAAGAGYFHMTANAKFLLRVSGGAFTAYALDNVNHVVASGFPFWTDNGDHAGFVSASDGNCYMARISNLTNGDLYIVKVMDETGRSVAQQRTDSPNYDGIAWGYTVDQHISGVGLGQFQDWIFVDTEWATDTFDRAPTGWIVYAQEVMAINVLTQEVRRFAHHRSRSVAAGIYDYQPRVSCAWDGSVVMWVSNFNYNAGANGYIDAWAIENPLGSAPPTGTSLHESEWSPMQAQTNPSTIARW